MASHCESLLMGKQLKMSRLASAHLRQESLFNVYFYPPEESKAGNPFLDQNLTTISIEPVRTVSMLYVTEYPPLPPLFQLPSSSPYDKFLKAADVDSTEVQKLLTS
ncbi:hypothetical protein SLEP1_g35138 [Rubroshorea leprosula]|uniref:Uncharacterized protein n=1 Tax=Rubroshorea leprosula TaxID=152421 RepID=A0AAV5KMA1_9ROSI|nr:hypothetical protein SLEP1_g35138 [Rubroshorea leprosula]